MAETETQAAGAAATRARQASIVRVESAMRAMT